MNIIIVGILAEHGGNLIGGYDDSYLVLEIPIYNRTP